MLSKNNIIIIIFSCREKKEKSGCLMMMQLICFPSVPFSPSFLLIQESSLQYYQTTSKRWWGTTIPFQQLQCSFSSCFQIVVLPFRAILTSFDFPTSISDKLPLFVQYAYLKWYKKETSRWLWKDFSSFIARVTLEPVVTSSTLYYKWNISRGNPSIDISRWASQGWEEEEREEGKQIQRIQYFSVLHQMFFSHFIYAAILFYRKRKSEEKKKTIGELLGDIWTIPRHIISSLPLNINYTIRSFSPFFSLILSFVCMVEMWGKFTKIKSSTWSGYTSSSSAYFTFCSPPSESSPHPQQK